MSDTDRRGTPDPVLPRTLGSLEALTLVIGGVIGSGIFLVPKTVAAQTGGVAPALIIWVLGGVLSLLGSLALAELAGMMPRAGGPYVYLREAYGPVVAFLWGWTCLLLLRTGGAAALAVAFALSLDQLLSLPSWLAKSTAIALVVFLALVNLVRTRNGARIQNLTTAVKAGTLLVVGTLPFLMGKTNPANWASTLTPLTSPPAGWMVALIAVLWAYSGWDRVTMIAEEVRNPQRAVPRALVLGVGAVTGLYLLANLTYHAVLSMPELAAAPHATAAVLERVGGATGKNILLALVMCSTFGGVNAAMLVAPRMIYAMARDGAFFNALGRVHPTYLTPANAILAQAGWTIVLLLMASGFGKAQDLPKMFDTLIAFVVFGGAVFEVLTVIAVFVLRRKQPARARPYRAWGYPAAPATFTVIYLVLIAGTLISRPTESLLGLLLIASGLPAYRWFHANRLTAPDFTLDPPTSPESGDQKSSACSASDN